MKKSIAIRVFSLYMMFCASTVQATPGIKRQKAEAAGLVLKKEHIVNHLSGIKDEFTPYFNWTPDQYFLLLNNYILNYYSEKTTGNSKYWSHEQIITILRDSAIVLPPSSFEGCWQTCGAMSADKTTFKWFSRNSRSITAGDAKTDEMFVCVMMKSLGGKPLPILSLNCGNGVRSTCVERIVYEEPQESEEEYEEVVYEEPEYEEGEEVVEHVRTIRHVYRDEHIYEQQPNYYPQQQQCYQQSYYPQNRLVYNYYGGGNNAGWVSTGWSQPSNYYNQQSWANNQSATSNNVNDNSNVFNNNTNVSYTSQPRPNTGNPNIYGTGSPASVPGSNGLTWSGPGGVPGSGNYGGPIGVPGNGGPGGVPGSGNYGNGGFGSGGPSGAGGSGGRISWH